MRDSGDSIRDFGDLHFSFETLLVRVSVSVVFPQRSFQVGL